MRAYLLLRVHASKATAVAGLATLAGDVLDLLVGAVGEVTGVLVVGHLDVFGELVVIWNFRSRSGSVVDLMECA